MKKFAIFAGVMVLGASAALAATITVPFFLDNHPSGTNSIPTVPNTSIGMVGLHNTTTGAITITVKYLFNGVDTTETGKSTTVTIPAEDSVTWRLAIQDTNAENTSVANLARSSVTFGACVITWTGTATDLNGRYIERHKGASQIDAHAYLLPPAL